MMMMVMLERVPIWPSPDTNSFPPQLVCSRLPVYSLRRPNQNEARAAARLPLAYRRSRSRQIGQIGQIELKSSPNRQSA